MSWLDGDRREADNHTGWECQWLSTRGWRSVTDSQRTTREQAIKKCVELQNFYGKSAEFRVYETILEKA